ncbi:MAG: hypothetical protein MK226_12970 [Saprospiraceae bacterium]|jgi:hypothetical protein|nr:hypothetical protein [Saprospiraceae bacterium]
MQQIRIKDDSTIGLGLVAQAYLQTYVKKKLSISRKILSKERLSYQKKFKELLEQDNVEFNTHSDKLKDGLPYITLHISKEKVKKKDVKKKHYYLTYKDPKSLIEKNPGKLIEVIKKDILIFIGKELK